ncbi:hypothetical protein ACSBR2_017215 [Camellia fascicularis]
MHFGDNGVVLGNGVVSTPIILKSPNTFYFLTLEGFSVGRQKLEIYNYSSSSPNAFVASGNGNIIIDSGTTLTYLPLDLYEKLESAVKSAIGLQNVYDPAGILSLCYMVSNNITIPIITAHFTEYILSFFFMDEILASQNFRIHDSRIFFINMNITIILLKDTVVEEQ